MFAATAMGVAFAHKHWRLNVSANNGGAFVAVSELEMRSVSGGATLCSGGTASASSQYDVSYAAAKAFDGDVSFGNTWLSDFATSGWLAYEFPIAVSVVEYAITCKSSTDTMPKDWTFEWSDDGTNWMAADTVTGSTGWSDGETRTFTVG